MLIEVNGPIAFLFDVHPEKVANIPFDREIKPGAFHKRNNLVQFIGVWSCQDRVIGVQDVNRPSVIKDTFIHLALGKPN